MTVKTTDYGVCKIYVNRYPSNGNLALSLKDECGLPITNITSNIVPLDENLFCLNINNMTDTLLADLLETGWFEATGEHFQSGFCEFPVYKVKEGVL